MLWDFSKVRLWQVYFSVNRPFQTLPRPEELVEECETAPSYALDGRYRAPMTGGQISLTLAGRGAITIAGKTAELLPGQAFLHNHTDPDVRYFYPPSGTEPWRFLWVSFQGGGVEQLISEINQKYGYCFSPGLDSPLHRKLAAFRQKGKRVIQLTPLEGVSFVHDLLRNLCEKNEDEARENPHSLLVGELRNYIAAHPGENLDTESLARRFGFSREHLSRIFRRQSGTTLQAYIQEFRLHLAAELLRTSGLSGKEVCESCGYAAYPAFHRAFVRRYGATPRQMRRKAAQDA